MTQFFIPDVDSWKDFVSHIVKHLRDGQIVTLQGPLGAGKTTFVQKLSEQLGAKQMPKSPTFSMMRTYEIHHDNLRRLIHIDAYRIENEADLLPLDLDEELSIPGTVMLIEWPEQIPAWLSTRPHIKIQISVKEEGRLVELDI